MQARTIAQRWHRESGWLSRFFVSMIGAALVWAIATWPLELVALLLGGTAFAALVFVQPRWGLYLLPFAVPFGSIREVSAGPATIGGTEALLGLFLAAWVARGVARRSLALHRVPLVGAIALWYGAMLLSTSQSLSLGDSIKELIKWGETFALYAIAANELRRRDIAIILGTTLAAGTLASLEGIYQALFRVGPAGFLFPLAGRVWLRAYGRFIQPNPYAGYLGLVLPLAYSIVAVGLGLGGPQSSENTRDYRSHSRRLLVALAGLAGVIIGLALFFTLSRGGWIGAGLAAITIGVLLSRRAAVASMFVVIGLALFLLLGGAQLLPEALSNRATDFLPYINVLDVDVRGAQITEANFSVIERLAHWQAAFGMWADQPWLGQGIGNYAAAYPAYMIPPWEEPLGHAHNLFLNTLAETGIIGLGAYLLFWGSALMLAFRAVRRSEGLWRGVAVGILGAMVHLHAHNFFDNLYVHGIYLHLALLLAIAAILSQETVQPEELS
jgi:putative inorganic carbon (HCO3(-)) transporter